MEHKRYAMHALGLDDACIQGRRSDLVGPRRDLRFTYTKKI